MTGLKGMFVAAIILLAVVAALTRILTAPGSADSIKNGSKAMANLFTGAFGL
jgi:hypothetical protein